MQDLLFHERSIETLTTASECPFKNHSDSPFTGLATVHIYPFTLVEIIVPEILFLKNFGCSLFLRYQELLLSVKWLISRGLSDVNFIEEKPILKN